MQHMRSNLVLRVRFLCGFLYPRRAASRVRLYFVQIVHGTEYRKDAWQYVELRPEVRSRGRHIFYN